MTWQHTAAVVKPLALVGFCGLLIAYASALAPQHAGLFAMVMITWIGLNGLNIMFGHAGQFNLATNIMFGLGAFAYAAFVRNIDRPWVAVALSVVIGVASGLLMSMVSGRVRGLGLAVLTLGVGIATPDLFSATSLTGGFNGLTGIPPLTLGGEPLFGNDALVVYTVIALAVFFLTRTWLRSSWAAALHTISADPEAAAGIGLSPVRYRVLAFVIGGALIGFAGGLYGAHQGYVGYTSFPVATVVLWYLGLILGGSGTTWGPLVGAVFITVLPERMPVADDLFPVIWGVLLVALVVVAPRGLVVAERGLVNKSLRRKRPGPESQVDVSPAPTSMEPVASAMGAADFSGPPRLVANAVSMRIGGLKILKDVSIRLPADQVTALLGANGAGKSTMVNCLSGYLKPTDGQILIGDHDVTGANPLSIWRQGLGRTFQHPRLVPQDTVFDNVVAGLHATRRPNILLAALPFLSDIASRDQARRVRQVLDELGIAHLADAEIENLSAGTRQIVSIARSLMAEPSVLLLDEPVAGLSEEEMHRVAESVRLVAQRGVAVLVIEHRLEFVRLVATQACCLDSGVLISEGPLESVLSDAAVQRAFLGQDVPAGEGVV